MLVIKLIIISLLGSLTLKADFIEDKVINIIGQENYDLHKNLVEDVIKDKNTFYDNKNLNYTNLLKNLKEKGLLNLSLPEQTDIRVTFSLLGSNKKGFKIVKDILSNIGYSYYLTDFIQNIDGNLVWRINFKSEFALDPYTFSTELNKFRTTITDINKITNTNWEYKIDAENGILDNLQIVFLDEKLTLPMPFEPYILSLPNARELLIASSTSNSWVPKISFYDKELNALGTIEMDKVYDGLKVAIPKNSKYVKISDRYTLLNLKRGLSVLVSNSL
jgi:hypothetical protein